MRGVRETRPCSGCGQPVNRLLSQARGAAWYCSSACQAAHSPPPASTSKQPNPFRGQQQTRPCGQCQSPVTRYLNPTNNEKVWYCSYQCRGRWQQLTRLENGVFVRGTKPRTGDTVACLTCGKTFYRQPAYIKQNRRFCSTKCWNAAQRVQQIAKECPYCGATFFVRPSETHLRHCSRACEAQAKIKRPTGRVHNGRPVIKNHQGYLTVYEPSHPAAGRNGRVLEHRLVVERVLGRYLKGEETVNHIDHDPSNNAPENLEILSPSDHSKETNAHARAAREAMKTRLAEYERRFGPLE